MAIDPTLARVNACAPRPSVSSAVRAPITSNDHSSTMAGFPLNAASERVPPAMSSSEADLYTDEANVEALRKLGADGSLHLWLPTVAGRHSGAAFSP